MSAGRADPLGRDEHARPFHDPGGDRVAQRDIEKELAPHIAHAGEAGGKCGAGMRDALEGHFRLALFESLQAQLVVAIGIEVEGEMGVRVDQAGRKRGVAEIDHLGVVRHGEIAAGTDDLVPLHEDDAVRQKPFRFAVEKASGFQGDRVRRRLSWRGLRA